MWNMKLIVILIVIVAFQTVLKGKETGGIRNLRKDWDNPKRQHCSHQLEYQEDFWRPEETLVKYHPLTLMWKTCKKWNKLLWHFVIQTDHLISARRPDRIIIKKNKNKKENLQNCRLSGPGWPQNKTERMWKEWPSYKIEKTMEHEGDNYTNCDWCVWHGN